MRQGLRRAGNRGNTGATHSEKDRLMFLRNHFQNAYVTHNLDKAMKLIDDRFGKIDWIVFDPTMTLLTPDGPKQSTVRAAHRAFRHCAGCRTIPLTPRSDVWPWTFLLVSGPHHCGPWPQSRRAAERFMRGDGRKRLGRAGKSAFIVDAMSALP